MFFPIRIRQFLSYKKWQPTLLEQSCPRQTTLVQAEDMGNSRQNLCKKIDEKVCFDNAAFDALKLSELK